MQMSIKLDLLTLDSNRQKNILVFKGLRCKSLQKNLRVKNLSALKVVLYFTVLRVLEVQGSYGLRVQLLQHAIRALMYQSIQRVTIQGI